MFSMSRLATRSLLSKRAISATSRCLFSTDLSNLLDREINEETVTNAIPMPEDLTELMGTISQKWAIVDGSSTGEDGATIKMYKNDPTANGAKVVLKFHCQDTENEEDSSPISGLLSGGDEDEELSPPLQFEVEVSRAGKTMTMTCISEDALASIDGITISPSPDGAASSKSEENDLYRGPILEDLPDDVKEEFDLYLREDCGVDEDVAAFAAMYADFREQSEYIRWLKEIQKIVK